MEQVAHWKGRAGDDYIGRNTMDVLLPVYMRMWSRILSRTQNIKTVLEVGANVGSNITAIQHLSPAIECRAIEPNDTARRSLTLKNIQAWSYTAEEPWVGAGMFDIVFTRGLLIHVNPASLLTVYENMYNHASRYIMMAEYFAPKREMIPYRGEDNLLWRADYAGEIMDLYPDLKLVDYFFIYKRDPVAPQDNITVFLMEKK